ncbi:MAG TPA: NAD-dependent epimerase/dehydratase family protein [Planctomycetes bacterium]|nr:NAD-dependent epimerase/dehydratase family protein [Planctomycetota bacterium]
MNKEFWRHKNVLVTGAGGFKGSHLVEKLSLTGARVISLMRSFDPQSYFATQTLDSKSVVVIGDLKNLPKMADILSRYEITTIFHLGAQPIVTTALLNPLETLQSNIMGTVNLLESARVYSHVREIVFVSSDKAYGPSEIMPYKEDGRLEGKAPYDVSKSCADMISQTYAHPDVYDMPITIARCANVFGPGDLNINRIVPGTMEAIIKNQPLQIRSDGKMVREYIYVKDSVDGYISLAENIDKTAGEAFNIASRHVMTVLEIVNAVSEVLGKKVVTKVLNQAKAEIPRQYLDGSKIENIIGWKPKCDFEKAVNETYRWYKRHFS